MSYDLYFYNKIHDFQFYYITILNITSYFIDVNIIIMNFFVIYNK